MTDDPCSKTRFRWAGSPAISLEEAARRLGVSLDETVRRAARRLPLRFPESYLDLVDPADPADPIRAIAWPAPEEIEEDPGALEDPVGENECRLHRLVIQKYPDRALLLLTSRCHFYCRFCFRADRGGEPRPGEIEEAIEILARRPGLREIILSGGDPLVLPDDLLEGLLGSLGRLEGLRSVRIHTRAPVHDPARVDDALVDALVRGAPRPLWMVLHLTHPRELTPAFDAAVERLRRAGIGLMSQSVLLRSVNDDPELLATLFRGLYERQVRPYYLHHPDRTAGTARFRLSIERGLAIVRALRERVPGPAFPHYVIDRPDGSGKLPVMWWTPS